MKPVPTTRRRVKTMIQDYETNIIPPPPELKDEIIDLPVEFSDEIRPVPLKRTKIEERRRALRGYTTSYEIELKNN